jgi:hypothetical protein
MGYNDVSVGLPKISLKVEDDLRNLAGEPVAFFLLCCVGNTVQYISNAARENSCRLMEGQLEHWKAKKADTPAHYNSDLYGFNQDGTRKEE